MSSINFLQSLQARLGTADWSQWEIRRWPMYDYVVLNGAGVNQLSFFAVPLGGADPVGAFAKTYEETNQGRSRSFGQVYYFIEQIRTHVQFAPKTRQPAGISGDADVIWTTYTNAMTQFTNLLRRGILNIRFGQKNYYQVRNPFLSAPPGFGIFQDHHAQVFTAGGFADSSIWVQPSPRQQDVYAVTPQQLVEPEQTVEATIDFPDGNTPVFTNLVSGATPVVMVGLILDGYIGRPAQ